MTIDLPKYVSAFKDRHGKVRLKFRRTGWKQAYPQSPFGTDEFEAEYQAWLQKKPCPAVVRPAIIPRSIDDLVARYLASGDFSGNPDTKRRNRKILQRFQNYQSGKPLKRFGERPAGGCRFSHIDSYIAFAAIKKDDRTGGIGAANKARKQIKRLFKYAMKMGWRPDNPVDHVRSIKVTTSGYHEWTEAEIKQYQDHWQLGTKARLALELYLWTGKRRSDGVHLGIQHIKDGCFYGRDEKTGKPSWIPVAPDLADAIAAMPRHDHLTFLVTEHGKPFSKKGFGNKMREWCDSAGLNHCSAHGLRKAMMRRMAELMISNAGLKSITNHSDDREVAIYTAGASQKIMAEQAMAKLVEWNKCLTTPDKVRQNGAKNRAK